MVRKKPLVSVVMPAYNAEQFAARSIQSVLNQTFKNFELIIVDDASSDKTPQIIKAIQRKDPRIRIITNKTNLLIAKSLNIGIKSARAKFIARMDIDDIAHPDRLALQYKLLKKNPKIAIVGANMTIIDGEDKEILKREYPTSSRELKRLMFRYSPFGHPAIMMRKSAYEEFGGYQEDIFPCDDIDLWFKIGTKYEFASIAKPLLKYRLKLTSSSHKNLKELEILTLKIRLKAIKKYKYHFTFFDIFYNLSQFATIWIFPSQIRIWFYNFLRSNKFI